MMDLEALQAVTGGSLLMLRPESSEFRTLSLDTRQITDGTHALFIALKGPFHDAHTHLEEALEKGICNFVISNKPAPELIDRANWLLVRDTREALQSIAAAHRHTFNYPVIGITGSNGKTWVKEWLNQILKARFNVVKNPKSYNSQVGVPLSVWNMEGHHQLGIFEAGISHPGEMKALERIICPQIGVFTCLADAHSANFSSDREKIREKWQLFVHSQQVVCCQDQPVVAELLNEWSPPKGYMSWTALGDPRARVQIQYKADGRTTLIQYDEKGRSGQIRIPFDDDVSRWNASTCIATLLALDIDPADLSDRFAALEPIGMRMELVEGKEDALLINDSYNADMEGLKKSLSFLQLHGKDREKWVVVSDLPETGRDSTRRLKEMAELFLQASVKRVYGIGTEIDAIQEWLDPGIHFVPAMNDETLEAILSKESLQGKIILFKGARKYRLDRVCESLEQVTHLTELEIRLDALRHNLEYFRSILHPGTRLIAVIKAAAYGIGSQEIARFLEQVNIDQLAVAYTDEGIELRKLRVKTPILVLNPDPSTFELMIQHGLEPEIYSIKRLEEWIRAHEKSPYEVPVHLKLETGMHRLGLEKDQIEDLCLLLSTHRDIRIASIMSHLAASEDPSRDAFSRKQVSEFLEMYDQIAAVLGYHPDRHVLNSNGILRFPEFHFEAVRLGIGLYGVGTGSKEHCRPVHRLVSRIAQIKYLKKGDTVGYGQTFTAAEAMKMATINLGYADGLPRTAGNGRFELYLKGYRCAILGNVCMDMTMIDVSHVPDVREGDEVVVFGPEHPMEWLSTAAGTIPYEILTGIGPRVKRRFIEE